MVERSSISNPKMCTKACPSPATPTGRDLHEDEGLPHTNVQGDKGMGRQDLQIKMWLQAKRNRPSESPLRGDKKRDVHFVSRHIRSKRRRETGPTSGSFFNHVSGFLRHTLGQHETLIACFNTRSLASTCSKPQEEPVQSPQPQPLPKSSKQEMDLSND